MLKAPFKIPMILSGYPPNTCQVAWEFIKKKKKKLKLKLPKKKKKNYNEHCQKKT